jgi:uncharacterized protein YukE
MADQLIVKPEEVRRYARELRRYASDLDANTTKMLKRLASLGDTWQDSKYHQFNSDMKGIAKQVKRSRQIVSDYSKYLDNFAARVEAALRTKSPSGSK